MKLAAERNIRQLITAKLELLDPTGKADPLIVSKFLAQYSSDLLQFKYLAHVLFVETVHATRGMRLHSYEHEGHKQFFSAFLFFLGVLFGSQILSSNEKYQSLLDYAQKQRIQIPVSRLIPKTFGTENSNPSCNLLTVGQISGLFDSISNFAKKFGFSAKKADKILKLVNKMLELISVECKALIVLEETAQKLNTFESKTPLVIRLEVVSKIGKLLLKSFQPALVKTLIAQYKKKLVNKFTHFGGFSKNQPSQNKKNNQKKNQC